MGNRNYHGPDLAGGAGTGGLEAPHPHKVAKGERHSRPRWLVQKRRRIETVIGQLVSRYNAKKV